MSKRNQIDLLNDIKEAMKRIIYYTNDIEIEEFYNDIRTQDAVVRNIEIIGEAVKLLEEKTINLDKTIEWSAMAKTRDRLIHHYFGVDYDIIWVICKENIPKIAEKVEKIIEKLEGENK